jgi:PAS domain S-box-containing protein
VLRGTDGVLVWESDPFGIHLEFLDDAGAQLLGYSREAWRAMHGEPLSKYVHPDDFSALLTKLYLAVAEGGTHTCVHRMLRADGSTVWAQTSVRRGDTNGGPRKLHGVTVDVTRLKEAELALRDGEAYGRLLVENVRDHGVFMLSLEGKVETWTPGARRLMNYRPQEIVGAAFDQFFPPDEVAKSTPARLIAETDLDGRAEYEGWLVRRGGETFWATVTLGAIHDDKGQTRGFSCIARDRTERKTTEQKLRSSEEHFRQLFESLHDYGVFMISADGIVESWNRGAMRLEGYRSQEIVGLPFAHLFTNDDRTVGTPTRLLTQAARLGNANYDGWLLRKCGTTFWASLTVSCVEDEKGRLRGFSVVARDLTERQQTDQALRRSEQHFRLLVESLQESSMFMLATDGTVESWNPGAQRVKGYRADEIVGTNFSRFFPKEEIERGTTTRLVRDADLQGHASYEGWLMRKGGLPFWASLTLSAVEDEHGRLIGFSDVCRDLSRRKATEDALRESEERVRFLIDSLQDHAVFMISPEGRVSAWTPGAERIKGYRSDEALGLPFSRFFPPEEAKTGTAERLLERAATEGRAEYEGWLVHKSGGTIWGSITLGAVKDRDGALRGFSSVARDLTERMRAERSQTFLSHASAVLAGSLDYHTTLERVAQLATTELAQACIVGMLARNGSPAIEAVAIAHVDPEKQRALEAALGTIPDEPGVPHGVGYVIRAGQSELYSDVSDLGWVNDVFGREHAALIRDLHVRSYMCVPMTARGQTVGAIAFLSTAPGVRYGHTDLTLAEELAQRAALAVESARLYEQAQNAICMREDILAVVSHDLRSPLSVIQMGTTELLAQVCPPDADVAKEVMERINRAADRMHHLIRDLLDFSSIDAGRLTIEVANHDLHGLIAEALDMLLPLAEKQGVGFQDESEELRVEVRCDRDRVLQVLSNQVGNAIKFMRFGGTVKLRAKLVGTQVEVSVSDTGPGIPEEALPHVFDRYWHSRRRDHGLGLGLAISKGIIEAHGGALRVESEVAHGTTFYFTLPLAR